MRIEGDHAREAPDGRPGSLEELPEDPLEK